MTSDVLLNKIEHNEDKLKAIQIEINKAIQIVKFNFECLEIIQKAERASLSLVKEIETEINFMLQEVFDIEYSFYFQIDDKNQIKAYPVVQKGKNKYENIEDDLGQSMQETIDLTFIVLSMVHLEKGKTLFLDEVLGKLDTLHWISYMNWLSSFCEENEVQIIMNTHHDVSSSLFDDTNITVFKIDQKEGISYVNKN